MDPQLTIADLSTRTGASPEQLRRWRALGLVGGAGRETFSREDVERARLVRLFVRRGIELDAIVAWAGRGELDRHVALLVPPATGATYTIAEAARRLGVEPALVARLWEAAGFAAEGRLLDQDDLEALRALDAALQAGFPEDALLELVRVFADAMNRVAETESRLFHFHVRRALQARGLSDEALSEAVWETGTKVSPLDAPALLFFHRKALRKAIAETAVLELAEAAGLRRGRPATEVDAAIAFVDLSSFTSLAEAMGDETAADVLERFSVVVRQAVTRGDGRVVKQIGDAFMLAFPDAATAVGGVLEVARLAAGESRFPAVRAGLHVGPVLYKEGDYVGGTVNVAARLGEKAAPHQVVVSAAVRRAAGRLAGVEFTSLGLHALRGLSGEVELFECRRTDAGGERRLIDPVCGMALLADEATLRLTREGTEYVFCSETCLRRFVAGEGVRARE